MTLTLAAAPAAAVSAPVLLVPAAAAPSDCGHQQHGQPLSKTSLPAADHCAGMANCGLCCVVLSGIGVDLLSHDAGMSAAIEPAPLGGPSLAWLTAPPLRPPRV